MRPHTPPITPRRVLKWLLSGFSVLGVFVVATVFLRSMAPTDAAEAALTRLPTASLQAGTYRTAPHPYAEPDRILLLRTQQGRLHAWWLPVRDNTYRLPDQHWWKPGIACHDLRPDFVASLIRCHDATLPGWAAQRYRWRLDGKSLSGQTPDMHPVPGAEASGHFVVRPRSAP